MNMKNKFKITGALFFVSLIILAIGCDRSRQVVPYDTDPDEVYKALAPNEEDAPEGLRFGPDGISGITWDFEIPTQDSDVYIFFQNFTLLDVNPLINDSIFSFIAEQMEESGFAASGFSLPSDAYSSLLKNGESYGGAGQKLLDVLKEAFESKLEEEGMPKYPFHLYFQIYPVFMDKNYVSYRLTAYSFTGGAHGMTYSYLKSYDLRTGKTLTLEDIVTPEGMEDVREEVAAHMAYSYPIYENITTVDQYIDSLNVWLDHFDPMGLTGDVSLKNFPLPNPALTSEGLAFVYEMYVLTPGSDGCPLVVVPYKDLKGCLKIEP